MSYVITGGMLLLCSIQDIKRKSISVQLLIIAGLLVTITILVFPGNISLLSRMTAAVTGFGVVILSKIVRGQIGSGDGYAMMIIGIGTGAEDLFLLLCFALLLSGVFSAVLLVAGKGRRYQFPFIPFLFLAFLLVFILKQMT